MLDFRSPGTYTDGDVKQLNELIQSKRKLNLGCGGSDIRTDAVNVDIQMFSGVDAAMNAFDLRVIDNDSVDFIVVQHLLEYIPRKHMLAAINEWRRILKPRVGHLEIRVTDISQLTKAMYLCGISKEMGLSDEMVIALLYGQQLDEYDIRYNGFTSSFLQGLLTGCGLVVVNNVIEDIDIIITGCKQ